MFDLETYNKCRAFPYCSCTYKLSKTSGRYNRDVTEKEYQKCLTDCVVFSGSGCSIELLDHVLLFKGEAKKVKFKVPENSL